MSLLLLLVVREVASARQPTIHQYLDLDLLKSRDGTMLWVSPRVRLSRLLRLMSCFIRSTKETPAPAISIHHLIGMSQGAKHLLLLVCRHLGSVPD